MASVELLAAVFEWLPRLFVLDVLLFHLVADDPLALGWRYGRRPQRRRPSTALL